MNIGQTHTVYHYRRDLTNPAMRCNLGCKHRVTYHESKRVTIINKRWELVPHLGYDHDAYGDVFAAMDAQGRVYTYTPTYDGPGRWKREDGKVFYNRPIIRMEVAFTLDGKPIK